MKRQKATQKKSKPESEKREKLKGSLNQKDKAKFRRSVEWSDFRDQFAEDRKGVCDCCKRKFQNKSKFHLHHKRLQAEHYTDISNKDHFSWLCSPCHSMLHSLHVQVISKKNPTTNKAIIDLQSPFFI